jgi:hypothetical protein
MKAKGESHSRSGLTLRLWWLGLGLPLVMVAAQLQAAIPASAANVVNVTFDVPSSVQTNPCYPTDIINLSGAIHVVIATTSDNAGGYHVDNHLNSQLSGVSITTGTKYVNSQEQENSWNAKPPFPAVSSQTYNFELISQSSTPNYILHMTLHETVDANGMPTATVDNYHMDCTG